jgi:hypothetical protein
MGAMLLEQSDESFVPISRMGISSELRPLARRHAVMGRSANPTPIREDASRLACGKTRDE